MTSPRFTNHTSQAPSIAAITRMPRTTISSVARELLDRHKVHAIADADNLWAALRYEECALKCYEVLRAQPSEAICARAHMYLSTEEVGPVYAQSRA